MKFRVIDGNRKSLEDRVMQNMRKGTICSADMDKLIPWGKLYLVKKDPSVSDENPITKDKDLSFGFYRLLGSS